MYNDSSILSYYRPFFVIEIDQYFKDKEYDLMHYKHIPISQILKDAPKYYPIIKFIERLKG